MNTSYPEIIHYLGRFHVVLLHLPIGCLFIAFLMEVTSRLKKTNNYQVAIRFILLWSALLLLLTSLSGYFLSFEGGYENVLLDRHFWLGLATTVLTFLVYSLKKAKPTSKLNFPLFTILMGCLLYTGHVGGSLTHGVDHLSTYKPRLAKLKRSQGQDPIISDSTLIFTGIVQPILEEKCVQCHNQQKVKGGLLLTSAEDIQKGGDSGAFLEAGNARQSLFLKRVKLPLEEKEHMPPRGKSQLTPEEIKLLEWWVNSGASFENTLSETDQPKSIQNIIERKNNRPQGVFALDIPQPDAGKLTDLQAQGYPIKRLAQGNPLLEVDFSNQKNVSLETLKALLPLSKQIIDLDLGHTPIGDEVISVVSRMPHLARLHLQGTTITDVALQKISKLQYLEYLNLYQTAVTGQGLKHLEKLTSLKTLYLWQTVMRREDIQELEAALPQLKITGRTGDTVFEAVKLNAPELITLKNQQLFKDTLIVKLNSSFKGVQVFYTLDGKKPDENALLYKDSIVLNNSADLKAISMKKGWSSSEIIGRNYIKVKQLANKISWNKAPSPDYPGAGTISLSDLKRGGNFVKSAFWVGWQGTHVTTILDYGEAFEMSKVMVGYMENTNAWVFAPKGLKVWVSEDGKNYQSVVSEKYETRDTPSAVDLLFLSHEFEPVKARYVKLKIESTLKNPPWHIAAGKDCWLFLDEIIVE